LLAVVYSPSQSLLTLIPNNTEQVLSLLLDAHTDYADAYQRGRRDFERILKPVSKAC